MKSVVFFNILAAISVLYTEASLTIPSSMLSPLGAPDSMGPAGLTAVKYAVGGRLLNMLGSVGLGPMIGLPSSSSGGLGMQSGSLIGMDLQSGALGDLMGGLTRGVLPGYPPLTPRSKDFTKRRGPNIPTSFNIRTATPTEVENFFAVLDKVDANKCISRLVCEVGSNPKVLEGLGHNIKDVMSSLRVLEKNALSKKYRDIMMQGQRKGFNTCKSSYSTCDTKSYRLIKTFVKAFRVKN